MPEPCDNKGINKLDCGHSVTCLVWDDASKKYICAICATKNSNTFIGKVFNAIPENKK